MNRRRRNADVLDSRAVAQLLCCSTYTVEEHARSGKLPGIKFGDGWVFPRIALLDRVNELAREEADKRRTPRAPSAVLQPRNARRQRPDLDALMRGLGKS